MSGRGRVNEVELGESSRRGPGKFTASSKASRACESNPTQTEESVSSFIKASQYKHIRMPTPEEFPSQPRGMYSYGPENTPATMNDRFRASSVPGGEPSSQRVPSQPRQVETAHGLLSRIHAVGTRTYFSEGSQAIPEPDGWVASKPDPVSEPETSLPCSSSPMDEATLAAMSQSTILDRGQGTADLLNALSAESGPSNNEPPPPGNKSAPESGPMKTGKGKGKAVSFSKLVSEYETHRDLSGSAGPSNTSKGSVNKLAAVDATRSQPRGAPFYTSDSESDSIPSGALGKQGRGKISAGALNGSTSI